LARQSERLSTPRHTSFPWQIRRPPERTSVTLFLVSAAG
jgi:hypothetical protein